VTTRSEGTFLERGPYPLFGASDHWPTNDVLCADLFSTCPDPTPMGCMDRVVTAVYSCVDNEK
jgi:hypothetical protein